MIHDASVRSIPSEPALSVQNLRTTFTTSAGIVCAVDGVSFAVQPGEAFGLVGESGCGKSATCRSIIRLLPAHAEATGEVHLSGQNLLSAGAEEMRQVRGRKISMIFQDPMSALNPVLKIGDQIAEAVVAHHGGNRRQGWARARELLHLVGIPAPDRRLHEYPHQFSGGMRQRVVIAIALAGEPKVLLADEPTTALDVTTQARVLALLQRMTDEQGTSVVLITHDMGVASSFCDDVQVMYAGQIVERGATGAVLRSARHHYTSALVRAVPRLDDPVDEPLRTVSGQPPLPGSFGEACRFADRCPAVRDLCRAVEPQLEMRSGHGVRCHFPVSDGAIVNAVAGVR